MTMWLTYPVMVKLKAVKGRKGWFELASRPYRPGYSEVREFADDYQEDVIKGAKIVGWHDDKLLCEDDPRFNYEEAEAWARHNSEASDGDPHLCVANTPDGPVMVFTCNRPEGLLFEYMFDEDEGPENAERHFPAYRADSDARYDAFRKAEAAKEAARAKAARKSSAAYTKAKAATAKAAGELAAAPKAANKSKLKKAA